MTYLRTVILLAALLIPTILTAPVQAQGTCGKRDYMARKLTTIYNEEQIGLGMSGNLLMELWASREPPYTWTILRTYPNGIACIAITGTDGHWKDNDSRASRTPTLSHGKDTP